MNITYLPLVYQFPILFLSLFSSLPFSSFCSLNPCFQNLGGISRGRGIGLAMRLPSALGRSFQTPTYRRPISLSWLRWVLLDFSVCLLSVLEGHVSVK